MVKKPNGDNLPNAVCVSALAPDGCGTAQYAATGNCANCGWGKVGQLAYLQGGVARLLPVCSHM